MHHQVGVGDARVDFLDAVDRQDVACRRPGELVCAVVVPMAIASASTPVCLTNSAASSGSVSSWSMVQLAFGAVAVFFAHCRFPANPGSPARLRPKRHRRAPFPHLCGSRRHCIHKWTGVFMSAINEPSIITELKPDWMERRHTAGFAPWSWCMTTGMCGYISTAAIIR